MANISLLVLIGSAAVAAPLPSLEHRARLDHASGVAEAFYQADVAVEHRQVGMPSPGGREATLRCHWTAGLRVQREARHASGALFTRAIASERLIGGSRPGWCSTQATAIRQEVARRSDELRAHVVALAREDHEILRGELDRMHATTRSG